MGNLLKVQQKYMPRFQKDMTFHWAEPARWSLDERQVSGEEEAGILGKGDEQEKELGRGGILHMEQEEKQGTAATM